MTDRPISKILGAFHLGALACLSVFGAGAQMALAVPPDPQRSFEVADCDAAKARLLETLNGSPLISKEENAETVVAASGWAEKLCGPIVVDELTTEFYRKK